MIRDLGYESMMSDHDGGLFNDPKKDAIGSAVFDVRHADMFVLVMGGRSGSTAPGTEISVTNAEYRAAVEHGIPIFTLVDVNVIQAKGVYDANKDNPNVDATAISYPAVNSTQIFSFLEEVAGNSVNNAYGTFSEYADIEQYLKTQ